MKKSKVSSNFKFVVSCAVQLGWYAVYAPLYLHPGVSTSLTCTALYVCVPWVYTLLNL